MSKAKEHAKASVMTYFILGAGITFVLLVIMGCIQFKANQIWDAGKKNAHNNILILKDGWTCKPEGGTPFSTYLPNNLNLPPEIRKVTLTNRLPRTEISGGGIRFECMSTTVNIYIDGKLMKSYGKITDANHFVFSSASNVIFIPLREDQYGKEISIELTSLFKAELGMMLAPQIGSQHDFLMNDLLHNATNIFSLAILLLFAVLLLVFYAVFQALHNKHKELLIFFVFTLLICLLYNSQNTLMWELFNYSDYLPAFNDWIFYIVDGFLPICGYLVLLTLVKKRIPKNSVRLMGFHTGLYILAAALQITWVLSINYFRPVFMIITLLNYTMLFIGLKPWRLTGANKYFLLALFSIIGAHIADYLKYLLGFFPLQQKVVVWLNLEAPFLLFLPWVSIVYMVLLAYALMLITKNDLRDIQKKAERDMLTGLYNRGTFEALVERYINSSKAPAGYMIIDIDHFKTINDTWGHPHGDEVLIAVAKELKSNFRNNDFVARLGGDEFAIFLPDISDENQIKIKAKLVEDIIERIEIGTLRQKVTGSVGVALYPTNSTYEELYKNADKAMYKEKQNFKAGTLSDKEE